MGGGGETGTVELRDRGLSIFEKSIKYGWMDERQTDPLLELLSQLKIHKNANSIISISTTVNSLGQINGNNHTIWP